jgi:hypothetical protein
MTRTRRSVVKGVGVAALAGLAGCSGNSGSGGETTSETGTEAGTETASSGGGESVEGSVRSSSTPLEITEQTYFEQENVVGVSGSVATTETQNVDQLGTGETWNFVVAFDKSSIESFNQYEVWVTGLQQSETGDGTGTASDGTETAASFE